MLILQQFFRDAAPGRAGTSIAKPCARLAQETIDVV
jgi:hypothetical protein